MKNVEQDFFNPEKKLLKMFEACKVRDTVKKVTTEWFMSIEDNYQANKQEEVLHSTNLD